MVNPRTHALRMWRLVASGLVVLAILAACSAPEDVDGGAPDPTVDAVTIEGGAAAITMRPGTSRGLDFAVDAEAGANRDVIWDSDDEEAATVDAAGIVSANSIGTATITATSVANPDVADAIDVRVSSSGAEWELDIAQDEVVLEPGGSESLVFTPTVPDGESDAVEWTTGDDAVVTVAEDGTLTAVAEGDTTVTGTLAANDGVSDTVAVSVSVDASVNIQQSDLSLYETDTAALTANVNLPDDLEQGVTWTSSDEEFVTIAGADTVNPTLTAEAVGASTITVTSVADPSLTDSITVSVEEIIVDIDALDGAVPEGDVVELSFSLGAPAGTGVIWSSGDASVATVDDAGLLTAVGGGTTQITATSEVDPTASATISVTVAATEPTVSIVQDAVTLQVDATETLTANVEVPDGESGELAWSSDDASVVTVADGVLTGVSDGSATVTAQLVSDASVSDTVAVTVTTAGTEPPPAGFDAVVTSTEDYDPYALQGVTPEPEIEGTLRSVLANAADGDVIGFADGITEIVLYGVDTIDIGSEAAPNHVDAHLVVRNDVTLVGPEEGLTIRGESGYEPGDDGDAFTYRSRMMYVPAGVDAALANLTITGGTFIFSGAGIRNDGTLSVDNSIITANRAWTSGGGIFNSAGAHLTLTDSQVTGNRAFTNDDEVSDSGFLIRGGPGNTGTIGNGGWGGGLYAQAGSTVTITNSDVGANTAKAGGGGVYVDGTAAGGATVSIDGGSVVSGNVADEQSDEQAFFNFGGGIYTQGALTLSGATVDGNTSGGAGGGLYIDVDANVGTALLSNASFVNNTAGFGGGIYHVPNAAGDNLTPDDPLAADDLTFTGNAATEATVGDDYLREGSSALRMGLRSEDGLLPGRHSR